MFIKYKKESIKLKERIQSFDIARTFAIICVVLCHSVEVVYSDIEYIYLSNISQIFRIVFFTIGRLGVPIFLFLTGALHLKKQIEEDEDILKFYKKNLLPLFIAIEIWIVLYNIFNYFLYKDFSITLLIKNVLFLEHVEMLNMWYMPMILGMYIAIPFLAKILKSFSIKVIKIPMFIVCAVSLLLPSLNVVLNILELKEYNVIIDMTFLGGIYGLYIVLGYYLSKGIFEKIKNKWLIVIATISFTITCIVQYWAYNKNISYDVWYNFLFLFLCSTCLFELVRRIKNREKVNVFIKLSKYISKISLGIFFVHEIFLKILIKFIREYSLNRPIETIIMFIIALFTSIIFIYIASKLKIIREKVFLVKE